MARVSQRDEDYESKKRALQAAIKELRKVISANAQQIIDPDGAARTSMREIAIFRHLPISPIWT